MFKNFQKRWGSASVEQVREYQRNYQRGWRARNKAKVAEINRSAFLKFQYGITQEDYNTILAAQDGECALCHRTPPFGHIKHLPVDHNHETNLVRGLLCPRCNTLLGAVNDDINWLLNAANYLNHHDELGYEDFIPKMKGSK